jgi:class 3 adenylate cyclase/tetratricopeptide (TPR) repeat protein
VRVRKENPSPAARRRARRFISTDLSDSGEHRQVTVLFVDLVGFTKFTARAGSERAYALMQAILPILSETVEGQGCRIKTFTGDGLVSFFGVPSGFEDGPLRACRAAVLINKRLAAVSDEMQSHLGVRPQLRMSISSGRVVFGETTRGDSTTIAAHGDAVNLGSRLLTAAEPGTILIGEQTRKYTEEMVETVFVGTFQFKGLSDLQPAYRLVSVREEATRFAAARRRGLTEFVGRADELETLASNLRDLRSLRIVDIAGEAGIGKSRLLHEFIGHQRDDHALVLRGSCSSDGHRVPYLPFIEIVRRSFSFRDHETPESATVKLEKSLRRLGLTASGNCDLLLHLLGLATPSALLGLDGALISSRTQDLLLQLLETLCGASKVILLIEDLHWIDSASEEFLTRLIGQEDAPPMLFLYTRRPEYQPPWSDKPVVVRLALAPLSQSEMLQIVGAQLGVTVVPESLGRLIGVKAEGNPLFAEEIASFLVEQRIVRNVDSELQYQASAVAAALPGTLELLLTAMVDRLKPEDRSLLQVASVVGRQFDPWLLAAATGVSNQDVNQSLSAIERTGVIYREGQSESYSFKHALVRDALLRSLLSAVSSKIHLAIACQIEQRSLGRSAEVAEILAHHFSYTDQFEQTFFYSCLAGRKCLDIYSLEEAEQYFRKALEVGEDKGWDTTRIAKSKAVVGLLESLYLAGNVLETKRIAELYIPYLQQRGVSPELVFALYFLSLMLANLCEFREGEAKAKQALSIAEQTGDLRAIAYARQALYFMTMVLGRASREGMDAMGSLLVAECESSGDNYILNWAYWSIAYNLMICGALREARRWVTKLIESGEARKDQRALGLAYWTLSWIEICARDYEQAETNADRALEIAAAPYDRNAASQVRAVALLLQGRLEEGLATMRITRDWALRNGWLYSANGGAMSMAAAMVLGGDIRAGVALLKSGIVSADSNGSWALAAWNRLFLAELHLGASSAKNRPPLPVVLRNLSTIVGLTVFGTRRASALLTKLNENDQFDEHGAMRAWIEFDLGVLASLRKRYVEARNHFTKARLAAEAQGATRFVKEIDAALVGLK